MSENFAESVGRSTREILEHARSLVANSPTAELRVSITPKGAVGRTILEQTAPTEFLEMAMKLMIEEKFTDPSSEFYLEFHNKTKNKDYYPKWLEARRMDGSPGALPGSWRARSTVFGGSHKTHVAFVKSDRVPEGFVTGMRTLWDAITESSVRQTGDGRVVGTLGPVGKVEGIKLSPYMRVGGSTRTQSPLNSFFWAAELGTGVAENVGAKNVRTEGDSKYDGDQAHLKGAWWLDNGRGGMLFTGQKAMHFLYDENQHMDEKWLHYIRKWLPIYVEKAIAAYAKAVNVDYLG